MGGGLYLVESDPLGESMERGEDPLQGGMCR